MKTAVSSFSRLLVFPGGAESFAETLSSVQLVARQVVGVATGIGSGKVLDKLGLDPTITRFASAFITGGAVGLVGGSMGLGTSFFSSGLQALAIQGVSELALHLGLAPPLANLLSITAGTLAGVISDPSTLPEAFRTLVPTLAQELAMTGITKLGELIGLDPRLASLVAMPLRAGLFGFIDSLNGADQIRVASLMAAIKNGFAAGLSSMGIDVGGISGLLKSITSSSLLSAIGNSLTNMDIFGQFLGLAKGIVLSPFKIIGSLGSGLKSFVSVIQEKGLRGALEVSGVALFGRKTIETIFKGGGIGELLKGARLERILPTGEKVQSLDLGEGSSLFFDLAGKLVGLVEDGVYRIGEFVVDAAGEIKLYAGKIVSAILGHPFEANVESGTVKGFKGTIDGVTVEGEDDGGIYIPGPGSEEAEWGHIFTGILKVAGQAAYHFLNGVLDRIVMDKPVYGSTIPIPDPATIANTLLDSLKQLGKLTKEKVKELKENFTWLVHYTDWEGFDAITKSNTVKTGGEENAAYFSKEIPTTEPAAREIAMKLQMSYPGSLKINPEKAQYFILIDAEGLREDMRRPVTIKPLRDPDGKPQDQVVGTQTDVFEYLFYQPVQIGQRIIYGGPNSLINWGFAIEGLLEHLFNKTKTT